MSVRLASDDLNPRPAKRQRHDATESLNLRRIPPDELLLSLPALIVHPPTHRMHLQSLALARHALRRCLALPSLEPTKECRAWTGIAELGMMWLETGASGLAMGEVEQALTKALTISQRHPALRLYTPHLTILFARLAQKYQNNSKFAISTLRRLLTSLNNTSTPHTPSHVLFGAHLELIHCLARSAEEEAATSTGTGVVVGKCLVAIHAMRTAAEALGQPNVVVLLSMVIKLQLLVRHGVWASVGDALAEAEKASEMFDSPVPASGEVPTSNDTTPPPKITSPVPGTLRTHLLMLGVLFHTYAGDAQAAGARLKALHELLDTGILEPKSTPAEAQQQVLEGWHEGIIEIPFETNLGWTPPLRIRTTAPRVLHAIAFLLSAVAKRDAVGRAPKKGVFANAGLELRELMGPFGGAAEGTRLARIKADLMCEVVAINTMRSSFALSQSTIDTLISHLRTHDLFETYAPRVTLLNAQLAHAKGDMECAVRWYGVAAVLAREGGGSGGTDEWVRCAARAGEVWVRIGVLRGGTSGSGSGSGGGEGMGNERKWEWEELKREGEKVARECKGQGAALQAVGELLRACLADEFLVGKQHLRHALELATKAQDNHLRAVVLALSASHYLHTAREHALTMLGTCGVLAAGLGAVPKEKGKGPTEKEKGAEKGNGNGNGKGEQGGNIVLGLWVGERMAELWRLEGEIGKAERQDGVNESMRRVLEASRGNVGA